MKHIHLNSLLFKKLYQSSSSNRNFLISYFHVCIFHLMNSTELLCSDAPSKNMSLYATAQNVLLREKVCVCVCFGSRVGAENMETAEYLHLVLTLIAVTDTSLKPTMRNNTTTFANICTYKFIKHFFRYSVQR